MPRPAADAFYRGFDVFWTLTRTEFRLRDQGTAAGFLWTLLQPLSQFAILYAVFAHWMKPLVPGYAAWLLIGIVQWNFFATATSAQMTSLHRKAGLLSSFRFPRLLVPLSAAGAVFLSHLLEWAVLLAVLAASGARPRAGWLAVPAIALVELALAVAVACPLAAASARFRDVERAWGVALYGLLFMTPVFYSPDIARGLGARLVALNPLAALIAAARAAVLGSPGAGAATVAAVSLGSLALAAAAAALFPRLSRGAVEAL